MNEEDKEIKKALLNLLADDIEQHPEHLRTTTPAERQRIAELVEGIEVDLDAPLPTEDDTDTSD